jgi:hypothetical protein
VFANEAGCDAGESQPACVKRAIHRCAAKVWLPCCSGAGGKKESITRKGERQFSPESAKRMIMLFLQKKAKENPFTAAAVKSNNK